MSAVRWGDHAHARLPAFQRRVEAALAAVKDAAVIGKIAVSFSGGKDSTVLLDLVRRVVPDAHAAFFDSGLEYPDTYEIVAHYGVDVVQPQMSLPEMFRHGGYWGYRTPVDAEAEFDFFAFLVGEPSQRYVLTHGIAVEAIGLRAEESAGRRIGLLRKGGPLYFVKGRDIWHLCPLAKWRTADIWAYLASRGIRYNAVYDKMAACGIDRSEWRVSTLLGISGLQRNARIATIRRIAPDVYWRLAEEFPKIKEFA